MLEDKCSYAADHSYCLEHTATYLEHPHGPAALDLRNWHNGSDGLNAANHGERGRPDVGSEHVFVEVYHIVFHLKSRMIDKWKPKHIACCQYDGIDVFLRAAIREGDGRRSDPLDVWLYLQEAAGDPVWELIVDHRMLTVESVSRLQAVNCVIEALIELRFGYCVIQRSRYQCLYRCRNPPQEVALQWISVVRYAIQYPGATACAEKNLENPFKDAHFSIKYRSFARFTT